MQLFDTHCHIHFSDYELDPKKVIERASKAGVTRLMVVGCTLANSQSAIDFAAKNDNVWASVGIHPHEAVDYIHDHKKLQQICNLVGKQKVVAIGEIGLDYYYDHSPKEAQIKMLRFQLDLATKHKLPLIFHVRDAFDDFWKIFDEYKDLTGVVHSFTASSKVLSEVMARGLYVGLNGIMTFTKHSQQLDMAKAVPLDKLVVETDAPYLTPTPYRGNICEPKHVGVTAEFLADLRGESLEEFAAATTHNAKRLFKL